MKQRIRHSVVLILLGGFFHLSAQSNALSDSISSVQPDSSAIELIMVDTVFSTQDDQALSQDSIQKLEKIFEENLVIPSYEDLLEVYYNAVVEVDKHLNFNQYRYSPDKQTTPVNPYVYSEVLYRSHPFDIYNRDTTNTFSRECYQIYADILQQIAYNNPQMLTATCDMIPDPPKAEMQNIIYSINVDVSRIDSGRQEIRRPDKIEKLKYNYEPWQIKAITMANVNQTLFSNWAKEGENFFSLSGRFTVDADYESIDKKTKWDNDVEFRLGYIQQENEPFIKNLDFFRLNTKYARQAFKHWFYALNGQLTTQFFEGYDLKKDNFDDPISSFFSPAYVKFALGLDYKYGTKKQKKLFSMQASPLSYKLTYVRDTSIVSATKYGVDKGEKARQEIGGSVEFLTKYDIKDKFSGRSRLLFFSNYIDNPQNVDLNWNTSLTYHFSRIFSVSFSLDMVYDDDVNILINELDDGTKVYGQRLQVKEFLGFGLTYRLM